MSLNPFPADPAIPVRLAAHDAQGVRAAATAALGSGRIIPAAAVARIVADFGLHSVHDLMLHLVPDARIFAQPPISGFYVGAIGQEASGDLILGCNLEFPGTHLGMTIHGEGFVMTRAFQRGTTVTAIALGEAHPCAPCRQFLSEFAATRDMILIDPLGHRLKLADLYPWPFDPGYLGQTGAIPGTVNFPDLHAGPMTPVLLLETGQRAYAPYSHCPGAIVLDLADGSQVAGAAIESVAFNPTIQPLQSALVALFAAGLTVADIRHAALGTVAGGGGRGLCPHHGRAFGRHRPCRPPVHPSLDHPTIPHRRNLICHQRKPHAPRPVCR